MTDFSSYQDEYVWIDSSACKATQVTDYVSRTGEQVERPIAEGIEYWKLSDGQTSWAFEEDFAQCLSALSR